MEAIALLFLTAFTTVSVLHSLNKFGAIDWYEEKSLYVRIPNFCVWCFNFWINLAMCELWIYFLELNIYYILIWIPSAGLGFHFVKNIR